jgi:hypothetical protein
MVNLLGRKATGAPTAGAHRRGRGSPEGRPRAGRRPSTAPASTPPRTPAQSESRASPQTLPTHHSRTRSRFAPCTLHPAPRPRSHGLSPPAAPAGQRHRRDSTPRARAGRGRRLGGTGPPAAERKRGEDGTRRGHPIPRTRWPDYRARVCFNTGSRRYAVRCWSMAVRSRRTKSSTATLRRRSTK